MPHLNELISKEISFDTYETQFGDLVLLFSNKGLRALLWKDSLDNVEIKQLHKLVKSTSVHSLKTKNQLSLYFQGKLNNFDLSLDLIGTPFQKSVWKQLQKIPYGKTCSYKDIATKLGDSHKARAVGGANNKNPIAVIVPCHRVIGENKKLVGYAAGIQKKQALLKFESAI